ncbi:hypothetical protein [Curtobacterium sp. 9128]|uniref:hypothetical protein n=1 Tax=Curtobacterium sp. 9128 TaxID=1793722 RepID=UPI00119C91B3|nr:hypothetical protein [Curtobacterium sp. 9128]
MTNTEAISMTVAGSTGRFAPRVDFLDAPPREANWAIAAAVAAILGLAVGVVAHICSVCDARSVGACIDAVQKYFGSGC